MNTTLISVCMLVSMLTAESASIPFPIVSSKPSTPTTYLINQNFEGTGYDNSETWTETLNGGTVNEDYTSTVLQGSQSLFLTDTAFALCSDLSTTWSGVTKTYGYFLFRMSARPAADGSVVAIRNSGNVRANIEVLSTGAIRIFGNLGGSGTAATTVSAMSGATTYHIWWSVDFTASPETVTVAFSTTGTRPTSGNAFASAASDISAGGINQMLLTPPYTSVDTLFDRVLVDDVQIGDNP